MLEGQSSHFGMIWQNWPSDALIRSVFALATSAGGEARLVGGCVRDHILHYTPLDHTGLDVDMAVNLPVISLIDPAKKAGLSVYETGLDHGTITLAKDGVQLELTQLRVDLETDGRHARIGLSDNWAEDARRRDFTINALYLDASGQLFDPTGGLADIKARTLRFIGDAKTRLAEDYLRLLRGFRFLATKPGFTFADAYGPAIRAALPGLARLSSERITHEWVKWLAGDAGLPALEQADEMGVISQLFGQSLKKTPTASLPPKAIFDKLSVGARMAALFGSDAGQLAARALRLSKSDQLRLERLSHYGQPALFDQLSGPKWRQCAYAIENRSDAYLLSALAANKSPDDTRLAALMAYQPPVFPLSGGDLLAAGLAEGPAIGATLRALEKIWLDSDFGLDKTQLLDQAGRLDIHPKKVT